MAWTFQYIKQVGQRIICYDYTGGMYRDTLHITADKCFPLPDYINSRVGVAIFVNYLTAYFSLMSLGNLREGEKVLILSCAGGVGSAATQIAKGLIEDVAVFGVGSKIKENFAIENGVDVFFSNETFNDEVKSHRFDLILTNEAGSTFSFLQDLLSPLGRIILIGANNIIQNEQKLSIFTLLKSWWSMKNISPASLISSNRAVAGLHLGTLLEKNPTKVRNILGLIFDQINNGKLKPVIHSVWPCPI
ncbi:hypothetical protein JTB14_032496 [Gonioctena quinquepunctata]|nr:hypothetical protein JTB14_032496 [Gonioctena quinquepunctata]